MISYKRSSGQLVASALIVSGPCYYYGFVCVTGGANRAIVLYDAVGIGGLAVETYTADGNKVTDGHSHSLPVACLNGLYLNTPGGGEIVTVFYSQIGSNIG
jgi:hypothetical protein